MDRVKSQVFTDAQGNQRVLNDYTAVCIVIGATDFQPTNEIERMAWQHINDHREAARKAWDEQNLAELHKMGVL